MAKRVLCIDQTWSGEELATAEQVRVQLHATDKGLRVWVESPWYKDPAPPDAPGLVDGLWEYEVVEVFVASAAEPERYVEVELGPHGHHLGLRFHGVRRRVGSPFTFALATTCEADRWRGEAFIDAEHLPKAPWRLNAFAIHASGTGRRYLLAHALPGGAPNFHQPASFPLWSAWTSDEGLKR